MVDSFLGEKAPGSWTHLTDFSHNLECDRDLRDCQDGSASSGSASSFITNGNRGARKLIAEYEAATLREPLRTMNRKKPGWAGKESSWVYWSFAPDAQGDIFTLLSDAGAARRRDS
jgi:hypothetical protein